MSSIRKRDNAQTPPNVLRACLSNAWRDSTPRTLNNAIHSRMSGMKRGGNQGGGGGQPRSGMGPRGGQQQGRRGQFRGGRGGRGGGREGGWGSSRGGRGGGNGMQGGGEMGGAGAGRPVASESGTGPGKEMVLVAELPAFQDTYEVKEGKVRTQP